MLMVRLAIRSPGGATTRSTPAGLHQARRALESRHAERQSGKQTPGRNPEARRQKEKGKRYGSEVLGELVQSKKAHPSDQKALNTLNPIAPLLPKPPGERELLNDLARGGCVI